MTNWGVDYAKQKKDTNKTIRIRETTHEKLRDLSYEQRKSIIDLVDIAVDELVKKLNNETN